VAGESSCSEQIPSIVQNLPQENYRSRICDDVVKVAQQIVAVAEVVKHVNCLTVDVDDAAGQGNAGTSFGVVELFDGGEFVD